MVNTARNVLIISNNPLQMYLKVSQKAIQKTADATGDLISNTTADAVSKSSDGNITKYLKTSPHNSLEIAVYLQKKSRKFFMI